MIEVELKFPVESLAVVRQQMVELGATTSKTSTQTDEYVNDPLRDFAKMDLALRIRNCEGRYMLTFKGPNLDATAKIRREIETPLVNAKAADELLEVFKGIGFFSVAKVVKRREEMLLNWQSAEVHVCLDEVEEVGGFVELELVVADEAESLAARQILLALAEQLGLTGPIRTSYLEMLLRNRGEL